jgi:LTXXQ motif family protein
MDRHAMAGSGGRGDRGVIPAVVPAHHQGRASGTTDFYELTQIKASATINGYRWTTEFREEEAMRALILAAAVAVLTSTAAVAQQSTQPIMGQQMPGAMMNQGWGPMMGQGWMGHMMGQGMMPMMGMMDPSQHVEGRLAFLKTELKITEAQAAQWNAYAEAVRANAKRMGELMNEMMSSGMMGPGMMMGQGMMGNQGMMMHGQPGTIMRLPDRLNRAERHVAAHMEMLQTIKEPTIQLYGVLSDEQKQVADQLLGPMGMM